MPLNAEFLADDPAESPVTTGPAVYGQRPAQILAVMMLVALALVTLLRWTGGDAATLEKAVQQPIPADAMTSSPRVDLTAPDPGDSPP